ncbi:MAG TPA: CPBP family intramembrane metalloprotease [Spirochaetota bacterium]|nr:CPBP family intramembrane metalloprotease [Spirochaetota bacterium]HNU91547.1 CPBP family intramembrane metalloprotease [Spirochaetota bacterium]HPI13781.1 CPBP family intramembrane metalloprotease [Spirochaetota bacterium]HPO44201.1 CPBP family intramembrane metalloprotease [Spirochaetota bacterium]
MRNLGNVYPAPRPPLGKFIPVLFLFAGGYYSLHHAYFSFIYQYALFMVLLTLVTLFFDKNLLASARLFVIPAKRREMGVLAGFFAALVAALFLLARVKKGALLYGFYRASTPLSGGEPIVVLLLIVIPFEEVFFRGFLQYHLAHLMGRTMGFVCASLIFALFFGMAGGWWTFAVFFIAGLYFGYVYLRTASVVLAAVLRSVLVALAGLLTF